MEGGTVNAGSGGWEEKHTNYENMNPSFGVSNSDTSRHCFCNYFCNSGFHKVYNPNVTIPRGFVSLFLRGVWFFGASHGTSIPVPSSRKTNTVGFLFWS